jgi:hypothetical protein
MVLLIVIWHDAFLAHRMTDNALKSDNLVTQRKKPGTR